MYFRLHTFVEEVHKILKLETHRKYLFWDKIGKMVFFVT